jgi:hypothetical protein
MSEPPALWDLIEISLFHRRRPRERVKTSNHILQRTGRRIKCHHIT